MGSLVLNHFAYMTMKPLQHRVHTYLQRACLSPKSCGELEVVGILFTEFVKQLPCTDEVGVRVVIHGEESSQRGGFEETAQAEQSGFRDARSLVTLSLRLRFSLDDDTRDSPTMHCGYTLVFRHRAAPAGLP